MIPLALHEHGAPSDVEHIKIASNYLRGSIAQELDNPITGGISAEDNRLMKFHGSYLQDDRDVRYEREQQRLEPLYQFMVRVRIAGGILTPAQWLQMDHIASTAANGTLRITTRQALQLHGVLKWNMRPMMRRIHDALLTTIAACGDVNRNVMCSPTP
ncbi:MAG: sulfite reductase, partial [Paenibacillaceae bacterium]|nr:sulfite reductase [Paenibacillaceae bacterium]